MTDPVANTADGVADARDPVTLAADVVSAYAAHNKLASSELPTLISAVHAALTKLTQGASAEAPEAAPTPAVPIKKSITPDHLICLDDGLKFKSLKRHLGQLGMTPDQYRAKWGLPSDYPMVSPNYAASRSELAKKIGLGQKRRKA